MMNLINLFIGRNKNPINTANPASTGASNANIDPPVPGSMYPITIFIPFFYLSLYNV